MSTFSSYDPAEVTWLLTDLSAVELEVSTEDREELVQGGGHYSEMLPIEYRPAPKYLQLFHTTLDACAERLAEAVGLVGDLLLDEAGGGTPVLVSLARAGTPVGILLRRWLAFAHDIAAPHYAISIIRGKGIDDVAIDHVLARHPVSAVRFVDGWTGKGAIARELAEALAARPENFDPRLAVLADPGSCTDLYGTRDDFLIPSACLNSTVSGLISRTVLRDDLIGPGMFHGAKHYADLAQDDVSNLFLDTVSAKFPVVARSVAAQRASHRAADRSPTWTGWEATRKIADEHGIDNLNLVKPGVGETTRVLLRRVPWQILVTPGREAELAHIRLLAQDRDVPVYERDDLSYSCMGLIRPVGR